MCDILCREKAGREECIKTGDFINEKMNVWVEVDLQNCLVTFILQGSSINKNNEPVEGTRKYTVKSPILKEAGRQFIPFYQLQDRTDSIV
jgi:hypothetical protein